MKSSAEKGTSPFDLLKWIAAITLAALGVGGFYFYGDQSLLYRIGGLLATVAMALALLSTTARGRALWVFAQGSKQEVRKVVWPTRQETLQTTLLVVAVVVIVAVFLWLMDILLLWLVGMLTGQGG